MANPPERTFQAVRHGDATGVQHARHPQAHLSHGVPGHPERFPQFEFLRFKTLAEKPVFGENKTSWREKWVAYLFGDVNKGEKRIDWKGIPENLLVELDSNPSHAKAVLSDMGFNASTFDVIRECAGLEVEVVVDGTPVFKTLPSAAREDFLRGARVFLALKPRGVVTPSGEPFEHHAIRIVSELAIREYWRVPPGERSRLFTGLMPLLVEQPGLVFEMKELSTRVAHALYSTLFKSMFGKQHWDCPCGAQHHNFGLALPPIIARGAVEKLPEVLDALAEKGVIKRDVVASSRIRVLVVGGNISTYKYFSRVQGVLDPKRFELIHQAAFGGYCDEDISRSVASFISWLRKNGKPPHVIVSLGSGTVIDVAKRSATFAGLPLVVVSTALSNDGMASQTASLRVEDSAHRRQKKSISDNAPPAAVLIDLDIVQDADAPLTAAGFGDGMKFTSVLGARRAFRLGAYGTDEVFGDAPYCPFIGSLLVEGSYHLMLHAARLMDESDAGLREKAFKVLAEHLLLCSYAITVFGDSSMVSRDEHGASHRMELDLGARARSHGGQVAVASLLSLRIRAELFSRMQFGISWKDQRKAFKLVGTPTSTSELGVEPARDFIDAFLNAQTVKPARHTLLCDLHRIFKVQPEGFNPKYLSHLRELHASAYGAETLPNEDAIVEKYGGGEEGLRKFVWAMAFDAGIVSFVQEEFKA